jgi:ATP-binding cassette subfamily B multidrug efflux pump
MWKYIKPYLPYGLLGALFMLCEVFMDLMQPRLMSRIIDEGVLGVNNNGIGDVNFILQLGIGMMGIALLRGTKWWAQ